MIPSAINYEVQLGNHWPAIFFVGLFFTFLLGNMLIPFINRRYLSIGYRRAFLISSLTLIVAYMVEFHHCAIYWKYWETIETNPLFFFNQCLTPGFLILFVVPFVYRLLSNWFNPPTLERKKTIGYAGFRAWLCPANLVCLFGIAFCYTASYDFWNWNQEFLETPYRYFFQIFIGGIAILSIYPMIASIKYYYEEMKKNAPQREDPSAVQNKILDLLSNGKITPQECADLLSAIYKPKETPSPSNPSNPESSRAQPPDPPTTSDPNADSESIHHRV